MSHSGPTDTPPPGDQAVPQEAPATPPSPPRSQLARRVATRIAELEAELERLGDDPAKGKQIRAILLALKGARDSMNLDAPRMGHMEAAQMTRWLESTQYLAAPKS